MQPTFLPAEVIEALVALLDGGVKLAGESISVEEIGEKDFGDDDSLILELPAVRVRYNSAGYRQKTNSARIYDGEHTFEIWCAAENLRSNEDQRKDTLALIGAVLPLLVGVPLALPDDSQSDPIRILGISPLADDNVGTVYIVTLAISGSAQFPIQGGS